MNPQLPIDVNEQTGVWSSDGLPMLYVPRHFFINNHLAAERALGSETYARILYQAGHQSAYYWCDQEAHEHRLTGLAVYEHYLMRLSQRGWGLFRLTDADPGAMTARIELRHSAFVLAQPETSGKLCHMFSGWFAGAMDWVADQHGGVVRAQCVENQCAAQGHAHCEFLVRPIAA